MPFDPNFPTPNTLADANAMRAQLNGLKELHDTLAASVITNVAIDGITALDPGDDPTVTHSVVGTTLHLSFGIPRGMPGEQGPQGVPGPGGSDGATGPQGDPGEVTNAALAEAIAGTARNPTDLPALDTPFADPEAESLRLFCVALATKLFRAPT